MCIYIYSQYNLNLYVSKHINSFAYIYFHLYLYTQILILKFQKC